MYYIMHADKTHTLNVNVLLWEFFTRYFPSYEIREQTEGRGTQRTEKYSGKNQFTLCQIKKKNNNKTKKPTNE